MAVSARSVSCAADLGNDVDVLSQLVFSVHVTQTVALHLQSLLLVEEYVDTNKHSVKPAFLKFYTFSNTYLCLSSVSSRVCLTSVQ